MAAALDSLDKIRRRTERRKVNYVDRVEQCVDLAGEPFKNLIVIDSSTWARQVKDLRHDLAHHRDRMRMNKAAATQRLAEQLYWLFTLCMLRLADAPDAVFERFSEHPETVFLRNQVDA